MPSDTPSCNVVYTPSCNVVYTPSMSTPNFGIPSISKLKILYGILHTHTFKHTPTPQMVLVKLCHILTIITPLPSLKIQIPPVAPPPPPLGQIFK